MLGVLSEVAGRKSVQARRAQTGDDSTLTRILSGAAVLQAEQRQPVAIVTRPPRGKRTFLATAGDP